MQIKGISKAIVEKLLARTRELSQGRNVGCFGLVDKEGYVCQITDTVDGGLSGLPLRYLLAKIVPMGDKSMIEGIQCLPENAVVISTRPGRTGLITDVGGVDFFNLPIISIGVKEEQVAGVGIIYPENRFFDLSTESENIDLESLATHTMDEEKEVLRKGAKLTLNYLELSNPLAIVDRPEQPDAEIKCQEWQMQRQTVKAIDRKLAEAMVAKSMEVGQGREVAMIAKVEEGKAVAHGKLIVGGMGYVPSRLLASSAVDVTSKSLREIYSEYLPPNAIIVHTHPGGTGVMHMGDANAGPGTWGRPIIAIGHDKDGQVRGATAIEVVDRLFELNDEDERLGQEFFRAKSPDEESDIRNRKFGIAQEFTNLCKEIEIVG